MTELFKEAIIEARKLKEIAEQDARNKVIEAVTPIIKKMIAKESVDSQERFLFGEEDAPTGIADGLPEDSLEMPANENQPPAMDAAPPIPTAPVTAPTPAPVEIQSGQEAPIANANEVAMAAPISPQGDLVGMPMPDDEGRITVDFSQLFTMGTGSQEGNEFNVNTNQETIMPPGDMPGELPVVPGGEMSPETSSIPTEAPIAAQGMQSQDTLAQGISGDVGVSGGEASGGGIPGSGQEITGQEEDPTQEGQTTRVTGESRLSGFQNELHIVAEKIDLMYFSENATKVAKESVKNRLFNLYENLYSMKQEGILSAKKSQIVENKLEFLFNKLNEAKEQNTYQMNKGTYMTSLKEFAAKLFEEEIGIPVAKKETEHAKKVSGVAPDVNLFEESALDESAPASSAFGDGKQEGSVKTDSPEIKDADALALEDGANSILEFDEKELQEAVAKLRKESLARKIKAVREAAGELKGSHSTKSGLSVPSPKSGDQGAAKPVGGKNPALEALDECLDEEVAVDSGDEVDLKFSIDIADLEALLSGASADFVAEPAEASEEEEEEETDIILGDSNEDMEDSIEIVDDEVTVDDEVSVDEPVEDKEETIKESKRVAALSKQLNESQLLAAKAMYVSKFGVRDDLTMEQKKKIASYFDKANSLAEAKSTYHKIKKILSENAAMATTKLAGSGSTPTKSGSATLTESVSARAEDAFSTARWQQLAGIKSNS